MGSVTAELAQEGEHHAVRCSSSLIEQDALTVVQKPRCHPMALGKPLQHICARVQSESHHQLKKS